MKLLKIAIIATAVLATVPAIAQQRPAGVGGTRPDGATRPAGTRPDGATRPSGTRPDGATRPSGTRPSGSGRPQG